MDTERTPEDPWLTPVRYVKGVGESRAAQLARLDIHTVGQLLLTLPRRYEDRRMFQKIRNVRSGDTATVSGEIKACGWIRPRYGKSFFEVALADGTGVADCRWYGAHYLQDQLAMGDRLVVHGKASTRKGRVTFQHPEYEQIDPDRESSIHMNRIVPVYPLTEDLAQRTLRRIMLHAVETFSGAATEVLPPRVREQCGLPGVQPALEQVHFPESMEAAVLARKRLVFEEFLCMQVILVARKIQSECKLVGYRHEAKGQLAAAFLASLSFELTDAQKAALADIRNDMRVEHPMHRLLQGDVGSGKTVVAACALLDAIECGSQGAVMTPTEVLAVQHARTFAAYLHPLGVRTALLTGDVTGKEREMILRDIQAGDIHLMIGTHAVIQEGVAFRRLGMAVIDEQHRFGVAQRGRLYKKGRHPDVLVMTATPIPRTLAMTMYGDLDVSLIRELPRGRAPVVTRVIKRGQLDEAYGFIRKQAEKGRQAFIIYPLVSESEDLDLRAAVEMYDVLRTKVFKKLEVGLVHGQMPADAKADAMERFRLGTTAVLVATTVVEVGIDVPNATVMLVEHAERFGLAQLHQLRGRVGRGAHKSYCILQGDARTAESWKRLRVMEETTDGFRIAEEDLRIRGMGNLLGREQSGLPSLRVGNPVTDVEILGEARVAAFDLVSGDPALAKPEHTPLRERAADMYKAAGSLVAVG